MTPKILGLSVEDVGKRHFHYLTDGNFPINAKQLLIGFCAEDVGRRHFHASLTDGNFPIIMTYLD